MNYSETRTIEKGTEALSYYDVFTMSIISKQVEENLLRPIVELRDPYERHSHKRLSTDPPPSKIDMQTQNKRLTLNGSIKNDTGISEVDCEEPVLADYVENFARALFLIVYMVFNCVYWAKYRNAKYSENL